MEKKKKKNKLIKFIWIVYIINSLLATTLPLEYLVTEKFNYKNNITNINDNWDITINNKMYTNQTLDTFVFDTLTYTDTIELQRVLPNEWTYHNAVLCFHSRHTTVQTYVDNELIYEYGIDRYNNNENVGSGLLFINLNEKHKGKEIKIKLTVTTNNAFSSFDKIWLSEGKQAYRYIATEKRLPLYLGFFLVVFGILIAAISLSTVTYTSNNVNVLFLAISVFAIGLWTLCYHNCIVIFSIPLHRISLMEYMSIVIAPVPLISCIHKYAKSMPKKIYLILYNILFIIQLITSIVFITLHALSIVHLSEILEYFYTLIAIQLLFNGLIVYFAMRKKHSKFVFTLITIGLLLVISCIGYDLVFFICNKYGIIKIPEICGISSIGIVILIFMLIVDNWHDINENMLKNNEREFLIKNAYTDDLTQLNNRLFCSDYMTNLSNQKIDFTIISFDLNGLKQLNDDYGHSTGDILIKKCAMLISDTFSKVGIVGRMGGDEFIAITDITNKEKIEKLIDAFYKNIDEQNLSETDTFKVSVALGYAMSTELKEFDSAEAIYNLADNRMYERKSIMKSRNNNNAVIDNFNNNHNYVNFENNTTTNKSDYSDNSIISETVMDTDVSNYNNDSIVNKTNIDTDNTNYNNDSIVNETNIDTDNTNIDCDNINNQ